jgi:hypothetical protein
LLGERPWWVAHARRPQAGAETWGCCDDRATSATDRVNQQEINRTEIFARCEGLRLTETVRFRVPLEGAALGESLETASQLADAILIGFAQTDTIPATASTPLEPGGLFILQIATSAHPQKRL